MDGTAPEDVTIHKPFSQNTGSLDAIMTRIKTNTTIRTTAQAPQMIIVATIAMAKEETGKGVSQKTPRGKEAKAVKATEQETAEAMDDQASPRKASILPRQAQDKRSYAAF